MMSGVHRALTPTIIEVGESPASAIADGVEWYILLLWWQTHRTDMVIEGHILYQGKDGYVITKVMDLIVFMDGHSLDCNDLAVFVSLAAVNGAQHNKVALGWEPTTGTENSSWWGNWDVTVKCNDYQTLRQTLEYAVIKSLICEVQVLDYIRETVSCGDHMAGTDEGPPTVVLAILDKSYMPGPLSFTCIHPIHHKCRDPTICGVTTVWKPFD